MLRKYLLFSVLWPWALLSQSGYTEAQQQIAAKNYAVAENILLKQIANSGPDIKDQLGEVYAYQQKWDAAIDIYKELTEAYPKNARYFFRYGGVLAKKAQNSSRWTAWMYLSRIKNSFKTALELNPGSIETLWALVDLYVSLPGIVGGSYTKAFEYAERLNQLSPLDGLLAYGYIYEYKGEKVKARANYIQAFKLMDQKKPFGRNQLNYQIGKISSDYGLDLDCGIEHLQRYIDNYTVMDGVPPEWAYYRLARIYRKKSEKEKAEASIKKALDIRPGFKPALGEREALVELK